MPAQARRRAVAVLDQSAPRTKMEPQVSDEREVTAAVLVIGDEILSGRTKDRNIGYIADHLTRVGIQLKEVRIVADDEAAIVDAVNALRGCGCELCTQLRNVHGRPSPHANDSFGVVLLSQVDGVDNDRLWRVWNNGVEDAHVVPCGTQRGGCGRDES